MKIGFYMAYEPYANDFTLKKEGLGRYLSFLLKSFLANEDEIVIACPKWCVNAICELLEDHNIDNSKIEFIIPKSDPILYHLFMLYKIYKKEIERKKKSRQNQPGKLKTAVYKFTGNILMGFLTTMNYFKFIFLMILFFIIALLLLPFILLAVIMYIPFSIFNKISFKRNKPQISFKSKIKNILKKIKLMHKIKAALNIQYIKESLQEQIRMTSALDVVRRINQLKKKTDVWYCHTAFWSEFTKINGTKILCVPDLVTSQFPMAFSKDNYSKATAAVKKTISLSTYFIVYCEYIKKSLLIEKFGVLDENVVTCSHAQNDMLPYINVKGYFKDAIFSYDINDYFVREELLHGVLEKCIGEVSYVGLDNPKNTLNLKDVGYIFYSSQVRGNKNMFTLVKSYEYLLRVKNVQIKLLLTCNLNHDTLIKDYIFENRLQYDILCLNNVSNQQLAALYSAALLVVNPTFYEGGFPFTFGEGMSVGTPSIMSDIPQVREVVNGYQCDKWLFDPFDYKDLAEKIQFGLENRDLIYQEQLKLYGELNKRTWEDVGNEYVNAFNYFLERDIGKRLNDKKNDIKA